MTPLFVKQVEAALKANEVHNLTHKLKKGQPGYRPESHQDLADETGADPNQIKNMFGGVRSGTRTKRVGKSKYVDPICVLLGIERLVHIEAEVPASVADLAQRILSLPPEQIAELAAEVRKKQ